MGTCQALATVELDGVILCLPSGSVVWTGTMAYAGPSTARTLKLPDLDWRHHINLLLPNGSKKYSTVGKYCARPMAVHYDPTGRAGDYINGMAHTDT